MTTAPVPPDAQPTLRDAAAEIDKIAAGEGSRAAPLKTIATRIREVAGDSTLVSDPVGLAREIASAVRAMGDWADQRYGIPSPLTRADRNRDRLDAVAARLAVVHEGIASRLAPPELSAAPDTITFGQAHTPRGRVTVVIPLTAARPTALASIAAVTHAANDKSVRILVVADASADPAIVARLKQEAAAARLELIEDPTARGFAALANAGFYRAEGDVALLDAGTLVADDWLTRLAEAVASAPDIATATPLSNAAPFTAWPYDGFDNPLPPNAKVADLAAMAWNANGAATVPVPAAAGFCVYIRKAALDAAGPFDAAAFAAGSGEDLDWSLRTAAKGWRHVAAPGVFVFHAGSGALAEPARARKARALKTIAGRHPPATDLIARHHRADPLAPARRALDGERLAAALVGREKVIVHLVHAWGGGVEVHALDLAERQAALGVGALVVKIAGPSTVRLIYPAGYPNLAYDLARPDDAAALRRVVAAGGRATLHLHQIVGLEPAPVETLMAAFADRVLTLHDFYFVTPEITLRNWPNIATDSTHAAKFAKVLAAARRIFTPSVTARALLGRALDASRVTVAPHIDEGAIIPPRPSAKGRRTVVTIGAFNPDKGALILAEMIEDAGARRLPLQFVLAGQAVWDKPPANVTVLGPYDRNSIDGILRRAAGQIAFLPSIVPETYMFSLSEVVRAGYFPVVFDLGAQAERVRALGWGHVLPLGTSPAAINDLLAAIAIPPVSYAQIEGWLRRDRIGPLGYYA